MYIFQSNIPTSQTTERNPKALDISTFDLEFEVDPLFQKTSAAFDEGGVEGLLLNHLCIRYVMPDWYSIVTRTCTFVTVPSRNWTLFCLCISIVLPQSGLLEHILSTKGDTYIYALCSCMNTWSMQTVYMGLALNGSSVLQLFEHCKVMEILSGICTCIMYRLYSLCMYLLSCTLCKTYVFESCPRNLAWLTHVVHVHSRYFQFQQWYCINFACTKLHVVPHTHTINSLR